MSHSKNGDLYWIEAEDFTGSNFAARAEDGKPARSVMATPAASGGLFVVSFQKPDYFLEYEFREGMDGFWNYQLWMRYATPCPSSKLTVALNGRALGTVQLGESGDFFTKYRWERLAAFEVPKGNHLLRLTLETGVIHPDLLILTPDDTPIKTGAIDEMIRKNVKTITSATAEKVSADRLWLQHDRNGVPLGGLGTGKIELAQDGGFVNISTNNNQDAPIATAPGCFLVYREKTEGAAAPVVRILERTGRNGTEIAELTYEGLYPFASLRYADPAVRAKIALEAFSPIVPYDPDDSSIPGALFVFSIANPTTAKISASLGFSWENLVGCGGLGMRPEFGPGTALRVDCQSFWAWNHRTGNDQQRLETASGQGLRFFGTQDHGYPSSLGEYALLGQKSDGVRITCTRAFNVEESQRLFDALGRDLPDEMLSEPGQEGRTHPAGIVWGAAEIPPGQTVEMVFALAWHFPVCCDRFGTDGGVYYANRFHAAGEAAEYLLKERVRLRTLSRQVPDRFQQSSLPPWLVRKIINDQFPLTTCTWFQKNGWFAVNEAPSMMHGCFGTIDQRTASQGPYTALFPELDKVELGLFGEFQKENGQITHDLGHGRIDPQRLNFSNWPDLVAAFIIQVQRYVHATGDLEFAQAMYARIPKAVDWVESLDDDRDGIPDMKSGRGNTFDNSDWQGCSSFVGSLWIAALVAAVDLARQVGREGDVARYQTIAQRAAQTMDRRLWTGAFYKNFECPDPSRKDGEHCIYPQVAGEWALDLADLPRGLPEDRVRTALRTIFERNFVGQGFKGPADEVMPNGDPAWTGTAFLQYAWVYFGALAAYRGLAEEAVWCWKQSYDQVWEINRQPWKTRLCGYALTGKFNGLPWYMTNTASWYIPHALSGFAWSIPEKWLRIEPHLPASWREEKSRALRLALPLFGARFWLWFDYEEQPGKQAFRLRMDRLHRGARGGFETLRTRVPVGSRLGKVTVDGAPAKPVSFDPASGRVGLAWAGEWREGETRAVTVEYA